MVKRIFVLFTSLYLLLSGCGLFPYDNSILPVSPSPAANTPQIVLPSQAPKANVFGIPYSPSQTFQPLTNTLRYNDQVARFCYEGLFELDETFTPQPLLCTEMTTDDNIHFTITLREGVLFHDGNPLTAADVAYSFSLAKNNVYAARLSHIASVAALADGTVAVTASRPLWNAAALFDFPIVRESPEAVAPGTGPYYIKILPEGNCLLSYSSWWQDKPLPVERIDLVDAHDPDTLVYSFQYGYISLMPFDLRETLAPGIHAGYERVSVNSALMQYIGVNTTRAPLDQYALRRALALALDRRSAVASVYGEDATVATLPLPPSSPLYSVKSDSRYVFDVFGASQLVSGLGYAPAGEDGILERKKGRTSEQLVLDFIVDSGNAFRMSMAEECAKCFRSAGFTVNVRVLSWTAFEKAIAEGDYDLYYAEARLTPSFDPRDFLLEGGAFFTGGASSAAMREVLDELGTVEAYTPEGGFALESVWAMLYDELPFLTVCFRNTFLISQRGLLHNQTPTFYNAYYRWADWKVTR